MAYTLQLSDGTTTISFIDECGATSGWCNLEDDGLSLPMPERKQAWSGSTIWRQGRALTMNSYENRTITLRFEIGASSWDNIIDRKRAINMLLEQARDSQITGNVSPVYLQFQLDSTTGPVYFDVLDGDVSIPEDIMSFEKLHWTKCPGSQKTLKGCVLQLTCKPFARGAESTIIDGTTIYTQDDSTHDNYVAWTSTAIKGDVPGPLRIRWDNINDYDWRKHWFVGLRDYGDPSQFYYVLETNAAYAHRHDTPTLIEDGTPPGVYYSGGSTYSWADETADSYLVYWTIPYTDVSKLHGKVRAVAVGSFEEDWTYYLLVKFGVDVMRTYPERVPLGTKIIDLGIIDFLPFGLDIDQTSEAFSLYFYCVARDGTAHTIQLDAIYLIPAEEYKFRHWYMPQYALAPDAVIEDIGIRNQVTYCDVYPRRQSIVEVKGFPIHATPGRAGRLCFLWAYPSGYYPMDNAKIYVYHTPYYLDVRGAS